MKKFGALFIFVLGVTTAAQAQSLGDASSFNAFIFGNYSAASDSDGPIAAGGAITGSQNIDMSGQFGTIGSTSQIDVYGGANSSLGGNLDGSGGNVYLQSGSFSANNNAHATVHIGSNSTLANAFAADETSLKALSASIAGLSGYDFNINYTNNGGNDALFNEGNGHYEDLGTHNNLSFTFGGTTGIQANYTSNGVNFYVLNITSAELSLLNLNANNITWNGLNATNNLLINVIGDGTNGVTWAPQQQTNGDTAYTLYNFTKTPTVTTSQIFTGSILAVNSTIDQGSGDIQGNVIANGLNQDAELHFGSDGNGNYLGYVPQAVPEPISMVTLGLGALGLIARRKRA